MPQSQPKVAVVMPVFNGETYLRAAIESILGQSFEDFELVVVDDGSTDGSPSIIKSYKDSRLRNYRQSNTGLALALNKGINLSRGAYIARMDADDISARTRLEVQYRFLQDHPAVGLAGTWIWVIDQNGKRLAEKKEPTTPEEIRREMMTYNCFNHGSVMFRKSVFEQAGGYSNVYPESQPVEDYALWLRILKYCDGANIPEYLYFWRQHTGSVSSLEKKKQQEQSFIVSQAHITTRIAELENDKNKRKELAYCFYRMGVLLYRRGLTKESKKYLLKSLRANPFVALKAYGYLGSSVIGKSRPSHKRIHRSEIP
jgi:glycosyltransferase involved in cell wall biosynthesis